MKVTFQIPSLRLPRLGTNASREEEALLSVIEDTLKVRRSTIINLAASSHVVKFLVSGEQFAKFIIARQQRGVANWIKELEPEVSGGTYAPHNGPTWVVDVSDPTGNVRIRKNGAYLMETNPPAKNDPADLSEMETFMHGHAKQGGTVTGRWPSRMWDFDGRACGKTAAQEYDAAAWTGGQQESRIHREGLKTPHITFTDFADIEARVMAHHVGKVATQARADILTELADAMMARADKQQLKVQDAPDFVRRSGNAMNALTSSVKRYRRLSEHFRAMIGGKSFAEVDAEMTVTSSMEAAKRRPGTKFSLVVDGVRKVLYYMDATPRVVIKVDCEHRYIHENDPALDWTTFRAKWSF